MKHFLSKNRYLIGGLLVSLVFVYVVSYEVAERRVSLFQSSLQLKIEGVHAEALKLAVALAEGKVSTDATSIIADCTVGERTQFDNRLAKLDSGLNRTELLDLDSLFERCASVQVTRRSVMVLQLENLISNFETLIQQRKLLGSYEIFDEEVSQWQLLLASEKEIRDLSLDQVNLQKEIISELLLGLNVSSEAANELREKGMVIRNELIARTSTAAAIRNGLMSHEST